MLSFVVGILLGMDVVSHCVSFRSFWGLPGVFGGFEGRSLANSLRRPLVDLRLSVGDIDGIQEHGKGAGGVFKRKISML